MQAPLSPEFEPRLLTAVRVVLPNQKGEILTIQRPKTDRNFPGAWELPGGKTDGKPLLVTAALEVYQETGILPFFGPNPDFILYESRQIHDGCYAGRTYRGYCIQAIPTTEEPHATQEAQDVAWRTVQEIFDMCDFFRPDTLPILHECGHSPYATSNVPY